MKEQLISEVYFGDCNDYMKTLSDKCITLAIPDPPYGINAPKMNMGSNPNRTGKGQYPGVSTTVKLRGRLNSGGGKLKDRFLNKSEIDWDNEIPDSHYFNELMRVSENQIIWGGNYFPLPPSRGMICWDKMQPWDNFSQIELAWSSYDFPAMMIRFSNTGGTNEDKKIHETQKPVGMYLQLLLRLMARKVIKPGDTIFDSHMGSQSLRIACYEFGFHFYGCEKNTMHFENGCERFEANKKRINENMNAKNEIASIGYAKTKLEQINPILFT